MNRRKLLSILGFGGAAFAAPRVFAETNSNKDGLWVEIQCQNKVDKNGEYSRKPFRSFFDEDRLVRGVIFSKDNEAEHANRKTRLEDFRDEYKEATNQWEAQGTCGARYKRVRGTNAVCPLCGHGNDTSDRGVLLPLL